MRSVLTDKNERYILLNATIQGAEYTLGNLYAPNKVQQQCSFLKELQQNLDDMISHPNQRVVLGGDFNVISDPERICQTPSRHLSELRFNRYLENSQSTF